MNNENNVVGSSSTALVVMLGSTCCLVFLSILLVVPIVELAIGATYRDQCPIEPYIPQYLIVSGACHLATIALMLIMVGVFAWQARQEFVPVSTAVGYVMRFIYSIMFLMSIFLFYWFIAGNIWIFGAKKNVVHDDKTSSNYCHGTLYDCAYTMLILTHIMTGMSLISVYIRSFTQPPGTG